MRFAKLVSLMLIILVAALAIAGAVSADPPVDDDDSERSALCHVPPGNPAQAHVIPADDNSWEAHFNHGDFIVDDEHPCPPVSDDDDDDDDDDDTCELREDCPPDDGDGDDPAVTTSSEPAGPTCTDVFAPFLANQDESQSSWAAADFNPAAEAYAVGGAEWAGNLTDLSGAWYTRLNIVPADYRTDDRDLIRDGNDAGNLCPNVLTQSPAIVAFTVNGEVQGLVLVTDNGHDVYVVSATILNDGWDILTYDPLFDGIPGTLEADRWDLR